MSAVRTACPYCGVGCGVLATADGQGGAAIAGDPDHPANFGRLCSKGAALGETLDLDGRLLAPRIGGREAAWDDALNLIARRFCAAVDRYGPDSVAFYVSGQLLTEDYYVANKLMKGFIGSANIDTNSRLCMASSVAGHIRAFGSDTVPGTYEDLEQADLVVLVGSNLAWCHPVLHQRLMAAQAARGTRVVTVDPRRTVTSDIADMHLGLTPGSDVALFSGLLGHIRAAGAEDRPWLDTHVAGAEESFSAALDLRAAAAMTGIDPTTLRAFYDLWVNTPRVVTVYSQGVNQASDGTDKVNAILNCHLATGRIGRPGTGPFSVTGQPNAMGGREVGGLATMLASHLRLDDAAHRGLVQEFWGAPGMAAKPGLKAVDLFDACADGRIKALWIMCTNPAVSMPRGEAVAEAIRACSFVAVSDIMAETETTALADVLLPATGWGEKDGTVTNSERRITRQRRFLPAPGQARDDWQIVADVARRMGYPGFDWADAAAVFDEYARLSSLAVEAGSDLDLSGLTGLSKDAYDGLAPVQWPVTATGVGGRFFGDGAFHTPDGRARMVPVVQKRHSAEPGFPLLLNSGRVRDHWHTMTRSAKSPTLSRHLAEPYVEMNPADAQATGIDDADLALVESDEGRLVARARLTDRVRAGQLFVPMHWSQDWSSGGAVNRATSARRDPISGQPELKRAAVRIRRLTPAWYGFAVCRTRPVPGTAYWARARTDGGWRVELAGAARPDDWARFAGDLLNTGSAEPVAVIDGAAGSVRLAYPGADGLDAAFFAAPTPVEVARDFVASALIDRSITPQMLVAGLPPRDRPDPGPTVCSCFGVGANTIRRALESGQVATVEDIGALLQAGTNCGSCRPELSALLAAGRVPLAAE